MKKKLSFILSIVMLFCLCTNVFAADNKSLDNTVNDTAKYVYETVKNPQIGSVGGEWAVLGLARSEYDVPEEYYINYYETVEEYVKEYGGVLDDRKYTEYSRVILALTAIGKNPADVAGYNLLTFLGDYDKTIWQGINGPIWALVALDSGNYEVPQNPDTKTQATREKYIQYILDLQNTDGGWSLTKDGESDPDVTGMALQALSRYQTREDVKNACETALEWLSCVQNEDGGFLSWNTGNAESCAQVIVALSELGISFDDPRFVKNGKTVLDSLMTFYVQGSGFAHTGTGSGSNLMATEQALYALVAAQRSLSGKNSLYSMSDSLNVSEDGSADEKGLNGKNSEINVPGIKYMGKTFNDIAGHTNLSAIEALAARGIINGKTETEFEPDSTVTRAEYAAMIVRCLGLVPSNEKIFEDVNEKDWFYGYAAAAYKYGIVNGISQNMFNPDGTITKEEAAVMTARAAKLCGMDTDMENIAVRDTLAGLVDYVQVSEWARNSLAFCYNTGVLSDEDVEILPEKSAVRAEIAQMLYNMLCITKLV